MGKGDGARLASEGERYARHLQSLRGVLPANVLALAKLHGIDDGLIVQVRHDREHRRLTLILRCGYIQMGYYDLVLTYEDAVISPQDEWTLAHIARAVTANNWPEFDIMNHEVDSAEGGGIEHRILFHPGVWFAICCRALHWKRISRSGQRPPRLPDRFPGGPTTEPFAGAKAKSLDGKGVRLRTRKAS